MDSGMMICILSKFTCPEFKTWLEVDPAEPPHSCSLFQHNQSVEAKVLFASFFRL
jgi:hypothetical protein